MQDIYEKVLKRLVQEMSVAGAAPGVPRGFAA